MDGLYLSHDLRVLQVFSRDDPWRRCDDLVCWQDSLSDQALDDRVAHAQGFGALVDGRPLFCAVVVGQPVRVPETPDTVFAPSFARARAIPQTVQGRGDGFIAAYLGKLAYQIRYFRLRHPAVSTSPIMRKA